MSVDKPRNVLEKINGAFSLVWYDNKDNSLHFARNDERPMYIGVSVHNDLIYASEKGMLEWLADRTHIKLRRIYDLKPGLHLTIYLENKNISYSLDKFTPDSGYNYYDYYGLSNYRDYYPKYNSYTTHTSISKIKKQDILLVKKVNVTFNNNSVLLTCKVVDGSNDVVYIKGLSRKECLDVPYQTTFYTMVTDIVNGKIYCEEIEFPNEEDNDELIDEEVLPEEVFNEELFDYEVGPDNSIIPKYEYVSLISE
jgi:hypothetical protein